MRCHLMHWACEVAICKETGISGTTWRSKRPTECEPGFLPRVGPFVEFVLNELYHSYFQSNYDACVHQNRCAEMHWLDGDETEDTGATGSSVGSVSSTAGVVSEVLGPLVESSRPKRAAAGRKVYTEDA